MDVNESSVPTNTEFDRSKYDGHLLHNPFLLAIIVILYIYLVKVIIPFYTRYWKAMELKLVMKAYNVFQIIYNTYMVVEGLILLSESIESPYYCARLKPSDRQIRLVHLYLLNKILDLTETIIFTLRKKYNQVTFLHVFHHIQMVPIAWVSLVYTSGTTTYVGLIINSFVHCVMYMYYFCSACDFKFSWLKVLKKNITKIQLVQFVLIIISMSFQLLPECKIPKVITYTCILCCLVMIYLFMDFYRTAYNKKSVKEEKKSE